MFSKIVLGLFLSSTIIQLLYWVLLFARLCFWKNTKHKKSTLPVTTIICAKNEAENLEKNLNRILNQIHHSYKVIVVNDNSNDTTAEVLLNIQRNHKTFTTVTAKNHSNNAWGKKQALTQGIEIADTEVLLMTDADCRPSSTTWADKMTQQLNTKTEIVLGFSPYEYLPGWLNKLIRFDTVMIAIQYLSLALVKMPYMGVGRNIAYKKSLFNKVGGFTNHTEIASGDDDLFIKDAATASNTTICLDQEAFVYTEPKKTLKTFLLQKMRHITTGIKYKKKHQIILAMFLISLFIHILSGIGLLTQLLFIQVVLACMLARMIIAWGIFSNISKKLKSEDLVKWFPILELNYLLLNIVLTPTLLTFKPTKWK